MKQIGGQFLVANAGQALVVAVGQPRRSCTAVVLQNLGPGDLTVTAVHAHWIYEGREQSFSAWISLQVSAGSEWKLFDQQEANGWETKYNGSGFAVTPSPRYLTVELILPDGPAELEFILEGQGEPLSQVMQVGAVWAQDEAAI